MRGREKKTGWYLHNHGHQKWGNQEEYSDGLYLNVNLTCQWSQSTLFLCVEWVKTKNKRKPLIASSPFVSWQRQYQLWITAVTGLHLSSIYACRPASKLHTRTLLLLNWRQPLLMFSVTSYCLTKYWSQIEVKKLILLIVLHGDQITIWKAGRRICEWKMVLSDSDRDPWWCVRTKRTVNCLCKVTAYKVSAKTQIKGFVQVENTQLERKVCVYFGALQGVVWEGQSCCWRRAAAALGSFWRDEHPESHRILLWSRAVNWWERSSDFLFSNFWD